MIGPLSHRRVGGADRVGAPRALQQHERGEPNVTDVEFQNWLDDEQRAGRMSPTERDDLLVQKALFDGNRGTITSQYPGKVAGYCGGNLITADDVHDLLNQAKSLQKIVYFEPIGFDLF
jgi:hypothetical protein